MRTPVNSRTLGGEVPLDTLLPLTYLTGSGLWSRLHRREFLGPDHPTTLYFESELPLLPKEKLVELLEEGAKATYELISRVRSPPDLHLISTSSPAEPIS